MELPKVGVADADLLKDETRMATVIHTFADVKNLTNINGISVEGTITETIRVFLRAAP